MSHFVVIVVGASDNAALEKMLAPFCEQTEDRRYLQFKAVEEEYLAEYQSKGTRMVQLPGGELRYPWDDMFRNNKSFLDNTTAYPEGAVEVEVLHKERYASFEEFVKEWHGAAERDPEHGVYGHWLNPNAKWDWWELGGRWRGFFRTPDGNADMVQKGQWNRIAEQDDAEKAAAERYDRFFAMMGAIPVPPAWPQVLKEFEGDVEKARVAYQGHPSMRHIAENDPEKEWRPMFGDPGEEFSCDRGTYLQRARNKVGTPFAILHNGVWLNRGRMGWFGMAHDEEDADAWSLRVHQLIDGLPDDTWLAAVDCHI